MTKISRLSFGLNSLGVNQTILTNETISPENSTKHNYNGWTIRTNNSGHIEVKSNSEVMTVLTLLMMA